MGKNRIDGNLKFKTYPFTDDDNTCVSVDNIFGDFDYVGGLSVSDVGGINPPKERKPGGRTSNWQAHLNGLKEMRHVDSLATKSRAAEVTSFELEERAESYRKYAKGRGLEQTHIESVVIEIKGTRK